MSTTLDMDNEEANSLLKSRLTTLDKSPFESRSDYFSIKRLKLQDQYAFDKSVSTFPSPILSGLSFHITGHVVPSLSELRKMIIEMGGGYEPYYQAGLVSHVVCERRPNVSGSMYNNVILVRPLWIVESYREKKLLDYRKYLVEKIRVPASSFFDGAVHHDNDITSSYSEETDIVKMPVQSLLFDNEREFMKLYSDNKTVRVLNESPADFITQFYSESRLHYLSTWKQELIVNCLKKEFDTDAKYISELQQWERESHHPHYILHIDIDSFFAQASLLDRAISDRNRPAVVCHGSGYQNNTTDNTKSTSDISSCNYAARALGISNGMRLGKALHLCPSLLILDYNFDRYKTLSYQFYDVLSELSKSFPFFLVPISVDEVYLCMKEKDMTLADLKNLITDIKSIIFRRTQLEVSIGSSSLGFTFSRIATYFAKPNGVFMLDQDLSVLDGISISILPSIGWRLGGKLAEQGVTKWLDLYNFLKTMKDFQVYFGTKHGEDLYMLIHHKKDVKKITDFLPDRLPQMDSLGKSKSVSCEISWGIRFFRLESLEKFIIALVKELFTRNQGRMKLPAKLRFKALIREPDAPIEPTYKYLGHGKCISVTKSMACMELSISWISKACIDWMINSSLDGMLQSVHDLRGVGLALEQVSLERGQKLLRLNGGTKLEDRETYQSRLAAFRANEPILGLGQPNLRRVLSKKRILRSASTSLTLTLTQAWRNVKNPIQHKANEKHFIEMVSMKSPSSSTSHQDIFHTNITLSEDVSPLEVLCKNPLVPLDIFRDWLEKWNLSKVDFASKDDLSLFRKLCLSLSEHLDRLTSLLKWIRLNRVVIFPELLVFVTQHILRPKYHVEVLKL